MKSNLRKNVFGCLVVALCMLSPTHGICAGGGGVVTDAGAMEGKHYDPKGKYPSSFTVDLQNGLRKTLPFDAKCAVLI